MSNLNIFKIGVGPSSSHTLGPLIAGNLFCKQIDSILQKIERIEITLYGSLSLTGKGHLTDKAVIWGLNNVEPRFLDANLQMEINKKAFDKNILNLCGKREIPFYYQKDIIFSDIFLDLHENGMCIKAFDANNNKLTSQTYYSIGGGFVKTEEELKQDDIEIDSNNTLIISIENATKALYLCDEKQINLAQLSLMYELQFHTEEYIRAYCLEIWQVMQEAYQNGINPAKSIYLENYNYIAVQKDCIKG